MVITVNIHAYEPEIIHVYDPEERFSTIEERIDYIYNYLKVLQKYYDDKDYGTVTHNVTTNPEGILPENKVAYQNKINSITTKAAASHSSNIAICNFPIPSSFSYPMAKFYHKTVNTHVAAVLAQSEVVKKTVEFKKVPESHIKTYIEFLKEKENSKQKGRELVPYLLDENGDILKDERGFPLPAYERVQDEYGMYNPEYATVNGNPNTRIRVYRWKEHIDSRNIPTIGYGHKITPVERKTDSITISDNYSVLGALSKGLSDIDIDRLLTRDIELKTKSLQAYLGADRFNWLVEKHPGWVCVLIEKNFNGGNYGVREWPKLTYYMGLTPERNITDFTKSKYNYNVLTNRTEADGYTFKGFANIPFVPLENKQESLAYQFQLNNIAEESRLKTVKGEGGFASRNQDLIELFIKCSGPGYDKYTERAKTSFNK